MIFHPHLQAQLARLGLSSSQLPEELMGLISDAYRRAEREQFRLERSLDIHVREIQAVYADLAWERDNLNAVLSILEQGLAILDPEGQVLCLNASAEAMLGLSEHDFLGKPLAPELALKRGRRPEPLAGKTLDTLVEPVWRDGKLACWLVLLGRPVEAGATLSGPEFALRDALGLVASESTVVVLYRDVPAQLRGSDSALLECLTALVAGLEGASDLSLEVRVVERHPDTVRLRFDLTADQEAPAAGTWSQLSSQLGGSGGGESADRRTTRWFTARFGLSGEAPASSELAGLRLLLCSRRLLLRTQLEEELSRLGMWVRSIREPQEAEGLRSLRPFDLVLHQADPGQPWLEGWSTPPVLIVPNLPLGAAGPEPVLQSISRALAPSEATREEVRESPRTRQKIKAPKETPAPAETPEPEEPPQTPAPEPDERPLRVLVAEDESVSLMIVEEFILSLGHECLVAEDGQQAWELYQKGGVDVVVSDMLMPGLTGLELCQKVRAGPPEQQPYFIVLTAAGEQELATSALEAGADDYLPKPLDCEELGQRLKLARRRPQLA